MHTEYKIIAIGVICFLVVFSNFFSQGIFAEFITNVLHKDVTFSGRSVLWAQTLKLVYQSPIYGYGIGSDVSNSFYFWSKGCVKLQKPSFACVKIGFDGTKGIVPVKSGGGYLEIRKGSQVEFMGKANFKHGNSIRVGGHFCVGDGFDSNVNCFFSCNNEIIIGEDCLLGWNVNIRDSDNHVVLVDGIKSPTEKSVVIGDHVWLCSYVDILKGVRIPNESIVAYRACVTRSFDESKILIGGVGGRILKHNVEWVH